MNDVTKLAQVSTGGTRVDINKDYYVDSVKIVDNGIFLGVSEYDSGNNRMEYYANDILEEIQHATGSNIFWGLRAFNLMRNPNKITHAKYIAKEDTIFLT